MIEALSLGGGYYVDSNLHFKHAYGGKKLSI